MAAGVLREMWPWGTSPMGFATFNDQSGVNPVAPGTLVQFYPVGVAQTPANLLSSAYVLVAGLVVLTGLALNTQYTAVFTGPQAPGGTVNFTTSTSIGGLQSVTVPGYASPFLSQTGYAQELAAVFPSGWAGSAALAPGGSLYALFYALAIGLSFNDTNLQTIRQGDRLQSSVGPQVDSWVKDFLGTVVPRARGENDAAYINRIIQTLTSVNDTCPGLQLAIQLYLLNFQPQAGQGKPVVTVFDSQTNPSRWATLLANPGFAVITNLFIVELTYTLPPGTGLFLENVSGPQSIGGHLGYDSFILGAQSTVYAANLIDPNITALITNFKAGGTTPLYIVTQN